MEGKVALSRYLADILGGIFRMSRSVLPSRKCERQRRSFAANSTHSYLLCCLYRFGYIKEAIRAGEQILPHLEGLW